MTQSSRVPKSCWWLLSNIAKLKKYGLLTCLSYNFRTAIIHWLFLGCSCGTMDGAINFELAFREYEKFKAHDHCNSLDKYTKHVMYKVDPIVGKTVFAREVWAFVFTHDPGLLEAFGTPNREANDSEEHRNVAGQHAICADSFGVSTRRDRDSFAVVWENRRRNKKMGLKTQIIVSLGTVSCTARASTIVVVLVFVSRLIGRSTHTGKELWIQFVYECNTKYARAMISLQKKSSSRWIQLKVQSVFIRHSQYLGETWRKWFV